MPCILQVASQMKDGNNSNIHLWEWLLVGVVIRNVEQENTDVEPMNVSKLSWTF